jgi:hypothetical protein
LRLGPLWCWRSEPRRIFRRLIDLVTPLGPAAEPFNVWRITAKKRMVAKLNVIKAELQHWKHHRTSEVDVWLRKVVQGYYQYHAVPGNTGQLRVFRRRVCRLWRSVLVRRSQRAQVGWDRLNPLLTGGFHNLVFCTLIPISVSTPFILGKSRKRKRARTDLCGGRPAMAVPTATVEICSDI